MGFTKLGSVISPAELCGMLHNLFSDFDEICEQFGVYKIETIGDAYLASTGCIPHSASDAQEDALRIAQVNRGARPRFVGARRGVGELPPLTPSLPRSLPSLPRSWRRPFRLTASHSWRPPAHSCR